MLNTSILKNEHATKGYIYYSFNHYFYGRDVDNRHWGHLFIGRRKSNNINRLPLVFRSIPHRDIDIYYSLCLDVFFSDGTGRTK